MDNRSSSNKTIAKNTFMLYLRMLFMLGVSLYTSRVILNVLGVEDFGIYNVVGGVVLMFSFMNNAMVSATQRYISYEQGSGSLERQKLVFATAVRIHILIAVIIFILAETLGLWFLNQKMNIADNRMIAANWVYQCSILSFMINVLTVPLTASVVAHEKMGIYAYMGILDASLKLGIVFLLLLVKNDKLIVYAFLVVAIALIDFIIYLLYCRKKFAECRYVNSRDGELYKSMLSFAGWSFIGDFGFSAKDYGVNIVVNLFAGVAVNASRGIAYQVTSILKNFVSSFQTAVKPQITKRYSSGNTESMLKLMQTSSKYSFFLMALLIIPFVQRPSYILTLWLGNVPELSVEFLQLALLMALMNSMHGPIVVAIQATGNIKVFQIVIAAIMFLDLPLSYILLRMGAPAYSVMFVGIFTAFIGLITRAYLLKREVDYDIRYYLLNVILKNLILFSIMLTPVYFLTRNLDQNFISFIVIVGVSEIWSLLLIWFLGLSKNEKLFIRNKVRILLSNLKY